MNAYVSGLAARVVFVEGDHVTYIDAEEPTERKISKKSELGLLLAGATDVVELKSNDEDQALRCLLQLWNGDRSLRMLQLVLQSEEADESTANAFLYLDHFLQDQNLEEHILKTVLATSASFASRAAGDQIRKL